MGLGRSGQASRPSLFRRRFGPQFHEREDDSTLSTWRRLLTVKIRQPSHEFTFGVGMTFVSYSLVLTPVV
jgi:hypothetical protein